MVLLTFDPIPLLSDWIMPLPNLIVFVKINIVNKIAEEPLKLGSWLFLQTDLT